MKTFSQDITAQIERASAQTFLSVEFVFSVTHRFANTDIPIYGTVSGQTHKFLPTPMHVGQIKNSADTSVDSITVEISNVDVTLAASLFNEDVAGSEATVFFVVTDERGKPIVDLEPVFEGRVAGWRLDEQRATFTIANEFVAWAKKPLRKITGSCQWQFKGAECGYSGDQTWCDKSYDRCAGLGNTSSFGGFRFVPALKKKEIWWGRSSRDASGGSKVDVGGEDGPALLPLAYGQSRIEPQIVYAGTAGGDNQYLHMVAALCEGPIAGVVQTDGTTWDGSGAPSGVPQIFFDEKLVDDFGELVTLELFCGASDQSVCDSLASAIGEWADPLRYTAYLYFRLKYDRDKLQGLPKLSVIVKGLLLNYQWQQTPGYTNNPALCVYDFLRRPSSRGGMEYGEPAIDTDLIETARAWCDDKGWTFNARVKSDAKAADILDQMLQSFRGALIFSGRKFKLCFRDLPSEQVAMALTEQDIVERSGKSSLVVEQPDGFLRPNTIEAKYITESGNADGAGQYEEATYTYEDRAAIANDGDTRKKSFSLSGLTEVSRVQAMCFYLLERARLNKRVSVDLRQRALALEPMDIVTISYEAFGWDENIFRVLSCEPDHNRHTVRVDLIEEDNVLYDDAYNLTDHAWHDTTLPDPGAPVRGVVAVSYAEEIYYYRGRSFTRWNIEFSAPPATEYPWWDYAEVWVKIGVEGTWRYMTRSGGNYTLDPVEEGQTYACKLVSVSIHGAREPFETAYSVSKTILGKTTGPGDLSAVTAVAAGDTVTLFANPLEEPDIAFYEVRLGYNWDGGLFVTRNVNPSIRLVGIRPGVHTFWMAAQDNAGNYSDNPVTATVEVFIPAGYTSAYTWQWDYSAGTFSNTEQKTVSPCSGGDPCLICSHTDGVVAGTWTAPSYDIGVAARTLRLWGDFRSVFESSDTTWDGVVPSPTTWNDVGASKTWNQIFRPTQAGMVRAKLKHKQLSGDAWSEISFFEILCVEITARYFAVEIEVTDPTADARLHVKTLNMKAYSWT